MFLCVISLIHSDPLLARFLFSFRSDQMFLIFSSVSQFHFLDTRLSSLSGFVTGIWKGTKLGLQVVASDKLENLVDKDDWKGKLQYHNPLLQAEMG